MKNILNPKWLLLVNTFPAIVLFLIFYGEFQIVNSLLRTENIKFWKIFGGILAFLTLLIFFYAFYLIKKQKNIPKWFNFSVLIIYVFYISIYIDKSSYIIPSSIPRWMMPENVHLFVYTFLMPTIIYSLFSLASDYSIKKSNNDYKKSLAIAILIPLLWYIISSFIGPFSSGYYPVFEVLFPVLGIISALVFLFYMIKGFTGLFLNYRDLKSDIILKFLISILLPFIGVYVNNEFDNIFGNFNSIWFYILLFANGIFLLIPDFSNKKLRFLLFLFRSITFSYTVYFFLIFLPFLPLAIPAIIIFGAGFLMLTPLVLFILNVNILYKDFKFLSNCYSNLMLQSISFISFFIIPIIISISFINDRLILNETLEYLYHPNYSKEYNINEKSLEKTLDLVEESKSNMSFNTDKSVPYISSYYNWLVFDNLTLSNSKISYIREVFFSEKQEKQRILQDISQYVKIDSIKTKSKYDYSQNAWISTVELLLENTSSSQGEYVTNIELPVASYISDYYLYIDEKKEYGLLSEKKSAIWVYSQILSDRRRDPGILYYQSGRNVALRIFPFSSFEKRKTGIEFIHKEPISFMIDNKKIELGKSLNQIGNVKSEGVNGNVLYISKNEKLLLKKIKRKPYFHFLVDVSSWKHNAKEKYIESIENVLNKNIVDDSLTKISLVNAETKDIVFDENWKEKIYNEDNNGGFFLDRAIKINLLKAYEKNEDKYPIFIVITNDFKDVILQNDFADFEITFPESEYYYSLNENNDFVKHSFLNSSFENVVNTNNLIANNYVYAYPNIDNATRYLADNHSGSLIMKTTNYDIDEKLIKVKDWQSALSLEALYISNILHPENGQEKWLKLVRFSLISKILAPFTSYIVLENESQKAILKKKQKQILSSNKMYDAGEELLSMSEPNYIFVALIILTIIIFSKRKEKTQ